MKGRLERESVHSAEKERESREKKQVTADPSAQIRGGPGREVLGLGCTIY